MENGADIVGGKGKVETNGFAHYTESDVCKHVGFVCQERPDKQYKKYCLCIKCGERWVEDAKC